MNVKIIRFLRYNFVLVLLITISVVMWVVNDRFMTGANVINILSQVCILSLIHI